MAVPLVSLRGLSKTYTLRSRSGDVQTVRALREIDLTIFEGEFVAIMGPSGSGKSTLLNILGCLDQPTEGTYELRGERVSSMNDPTLAALRNRELGFIFQSFNLLPGSDAIGNVELPLRYAKRPDARAAALDALSKVGLADRVDHLPSELSGGQQQRVAIARALVYNPSLILGDEPTGNLDSVTSREIMELLVGLHQAGRTIILVTHEEEVAAYCTRVIRVRDGVISSDQARA